MPTHPLNKAYYPGAVDVTKLKQKIRITNSYSDFIKKFYLIYYYPKKTKNPDE